MKLPLGNIDRCHRRARLTCITQTTSKSRGAFRCYYSPTRNEISLDFLSADNAAGKISRASLNAQRFIGISAAFVPMAGQPLQFQSARVSVFFDTSLALLSTDIPFGHVKCLPTRHFPATSLLPTQFPSINLTLLCEHDFLLPAPFYQPKYSSAYSSNSPLSIPSCERKIRAPPSSQRGSRAPSRHTKSLLEAESGKHR